MDDDIKQLSPNSIIGREGALLQVTSWRAFGSPYYEDPAPQRGDLVLLVATEEIDEDHGWIDVLHAEKVIRLEVHPKYWMRHFMPWPRGGFV